VLAAHWAKAWSDAQKSGSKSSFPKGHGKNLYAKRKTRAGSRDAPNGRARQSRIGLHSQLFGKLQRGQMALASLSFPTVTPGLALLAADFSAAAGLGHPISFPTSQRAVD